MDIQTDNPAGRVPDSSRMRSSTLALRDSGWQLGRRSGGWGGSLIHTLPFLDTQHELTLFGVPSAAAGPELRDYVCRAIARGTYVSTHADIPGLTSIESGEPTPPILGGRDSSDAAVRARQTFPELHRVDPSSQCGELLWDNRAVEQRRTVLRPLIDPLPTVSMVLVTRRPELVASMVAQIATMDYPNLEIVVGLHGCPPPPGLKEHAGDRELHVHEFGADVVFGAVVDETFSRTSGELVTKIDDDDYYGHEHAWDLVAAHRYSKATLIGKTTTVVYVEALNATVRRVFGTRESYTHRVAGGTMLLAREDLRKLGGWPAVPRGVDTALINRVRQHGGLIYQPHDLGYLYMRQLDSASHTWAAGVGHFLRNTREQWVGLLKHPAFRTSHL